MKISIITITKNNASGLLKTIESVISQTFRNIEYIIVDGQSNDETSSILKNLSPEIRFISEPDSGIYNAMNKGVNIATGDYIMFLNSGDHFVAYFSLQFWTSKMINKPARIYFARILWHSFENNDISVSNHDYLKYTWQLFDDNYPHPATLYNKDVFTQIGLFDESYKIMGDYEFNLRALLLNRISFCYTEIITTSFYANGLSVNKSSEAVRDFENISIRNKYFNNKELFIIKSNHNKTQNSFLIKCISNIFNFYLNRIY